MQLGFKFNFKKQKYMQTGEYDFCNGCDKELIDGEEVYVSDELSLKNSWYEGTTLCQKCAKKIEVKR